MQVAQRQVERLEQMVAKGVASDRELLEARAQLAEAEARFVEAEAEMDATIDSEAEAPPPDGR